METNLTNEVTNELPPNRSVTPIVFRKFQEELSIGPSSTIYSSDLVEREIALYEDKIKELKHVLSSCNNSIFVMGAGIYKPKNKSEQFVRAIKENKWKFIVMVILLIVTLCLVGVLTWFLITNRGENNEIDPNTNDTGKFSK